MDRDGKNADGVKASPSREMYRMDVELIGANKNAAVLREEQQPYFEQYFNSGYTGRIHTFKRVTYKDIYPNIDWTFTSMQMVNWSMTLLSIQAVKWPISVYNMVVRPA